MLIRAMTSHYRRHPLQLLALALMIVVATMLWTGVSVLTGQARESLAVSEESVAAREAVVRADGQPVTVEDFVTLRRAGVCVAPWLETALGDPARRVIGIDPLAMACFDVPPAGDSAVGVAGELTGDPFVDISEVTGGSGRAEQSGQLSLLISPDTEFLPEGYQRRSFQLGPATGELADSFLLNLDALSLLVLFITGLLVRSVYHLGLAQRRSSFALLERFGVTKSRLQRLLAMELTLLTLICVVPGVWLGQALANRLGQGFGLALDSLFDLSLYAGEDTPVPWQAGLVMLVLVLGVCLVDRLIPERTGYQSKPSEPAVLPWWVWALMVAIGVEMVIWAFSLVWVFVGTALVFTGIGGLMPGLLARSADAVARRQSPGAPLGRWRYRELAVMFRQLALPVVALQFAMATVLAVQALVTTFEDTFEQWLAQRLSAELYVEIPESASAEGGSRTLADLNGLGDWHHVRRGKVQLPDINAEGEPVTTDLMALSPITSLVTDWTLLESVEEPWTALSSGGVMVNEQLARRQGLSLGQRLTVGIGSASLTMPVVGVYADYGRPAAELLIDGAGLPDDFTPSFQSFSVNPGERSVKDIGQRLKDEWQVADLVIRDNASIQALASQVFQQTFLLTRAISVLTLVLASLSLLVMGWVFFSTRSWYFHLLGIWGLQPDAVRAQLRRLALLLTSGVTLVALPLGVWLTWVLVSRINPLAFGWSLPMAVYPGFWVELGVVMALIGLVIAWLIGRQLNGQVSLRPGASLAGGGER
ncbi:FtsX-like permease family protein [Marinobacter confluentis]|uniref:ABC transporter permease n=1 Tax=Marinobacter confluentis TaxID=1697557 RepID=A0A4Z1BBE9_9GAMM|nr:ABC transporter permease [Marinobacter confluentis]TGN39276.1 ABC transporter permease [Marinobacter confluentis]